MLGSFSLPQSVEDHHRFQLGDGKSLYPISQISGTPLVLATLNSSRQRSLRPSPCGNSEEAGGARALTSSQTATARHSALRPARLPDGNLRATQQRGGHGSQGVGEADQRLDGEVHHASLDALDEDAIEGYPLC
jgi:hypothetical protein